jgi:glycosyltransferase involved in cell wall biosynthesis
VTGIRIFHIIDNLRLAGAQRELVNLVGGLAERNYEQHVYCLNDTYPPQLAEALRAHGARVVVLGRVQLASTVGLLRLFIDMRRLRPAIVHTRLFFSDIIGRTLGHIAGVPRIITTIETRNIDKQAWQFLLDRLTTPWADRVVFNSEYGIPFSIAFEGTDPQKVLYIPNGVSLSAPRPNARENLLAELQLAPETRLLGMAARLSPQKGHTYLIDALVSVVRHIPDVAVLLMGSGPLQPQLEARVEQLGVTRHVHFLGVREDMPDLLASLDLYVHSTLFEGMPNAVMEAMLAGNPVIVTAVDAVPELILEGRTGWLVPPRDVDALAQRIIYALDHPEEARRVGAAAAERMRREFSVAKMVQSFDTLYHDLLQDTRNPAQ